MRLFFCYLFIAVALSASAQSNEFVCEWVLDSAAGNTNRIHNEWAYFSADGYFWRFSPKEDGYVVDSALKVDFRQGHITDASGKNVFDFGIWNDGRLAVADSLDIRTFYKKWKVVDVPKTVDKWLERKAVKEKLTGTWKMHYAQDSVVFLGKKLENGTTIHFANYDTISVQYDENELEDYYMVNVMGKYMSIYSLYNWSEIKNSRTWVVILASVEPDKIVLKIRDEEAQTPKYWQVAFHRIND